jgi:hypothetical protein
MNGVIFSIFIWCVMRWVRKLNGVSRNMSNGMKFERKEIFGTHTHTHVNTNGCFNEWMEKAEIKKITQENDLLVILRDEEEKGSSEKIWSY